MNQATKRSKLYCDGTYICKTGRAFSIRCKEHMNDVNPKNLAQLESNEVNNKSALENMSIYKIIQMDWNNSKIWAKETDYTNIFLQSFFIHSNNHASTIIQPLFNFFISSWKFSNC